MPLQITGRHMSISDEQKDYIDKKVNRLRRMCSKIDEISFTLTKEKVNIEAEARFRSGRLVAQATVTASQPLEAIDALVDKLEIQISKSKEKLVAKKSNGRDKAVLRETESGTEEEEGEAEIPGEEVMEA